jgi:hypothetical protein
MSDGNVSRHKTGFLEFAPAGNGISWGAKVFVLP